MLLKLPGVSARKINGLDAYFVSDRMFACICGSGVGLRLPAADARELQFGRADVGPFQPTGLPMSKEWVQINLARVYAGLEFLRLINWKVAWTATRGSLSPADASATKVFGTEFYLESFRLLMEIMGQRGYLKRGSPEVVFEGQLENLYRGLLILTFGGGTNEIQRDLIGLFGLGLPRVPRM